MELVKHETCQQYVARRLSEGWRIIKQEGVSVILRSPEGIIRPIDLRNDVETLRPNASGDEESISWATSGAGNHWQDVVNIAPGEVRGDVGAYLRDLYNLPASTGSGTINNIKIYFRVYHHPTHLTYAKPSLKSNSTVTDGTEIVIPTGPWSQTTYSQTWTTNPADSQPWGSDWSVIDALQIGVSLKANGPASAYCLQVYVEVDYTPSNWTGKVSGVTNPAKVMGVDRVNIGEVKGVASA